MSGRDSKRDRHSARASGYRPVVAGNSSEPVTFGLACGCAARRGNLGEWRASTVSSASSSTSWSCAAGAIVRRTSRSSVASPTRRPGPPDPAATLRSHGPRHNPGELRTTSSRNSLGYGLGMVYILPAAPLGTTDQRSPNLAAVPGCQPSRLNHTSPCPRSRGRPRTRSSIMTSSGGRSPG